MRGVGSFPRLSYSFESNRASALEHTNQKKSTTKKQQKRKGAQLQTEPKFHHRRGFEELVRGRRIRGFAGRDRGRGSGHLACVAHRAGVRPGGRRD